jgi:glycosyltransferase involved in cell wall biosynthesis
MSISVDLIILGHRATDLHWSLGNVCSCDKNPRALVSTCEEWIAKRSTEWLLIWDDSLRPPNVDAVVLSASLRGDIMHCGLLLGMGDQAAAVDTVSPTWMFNADPPPEIEATSWRLSFEACLLRREVFVHLGLPHVTFRTLEGAALEYGHRCISSGALVRHVPQLVDIREPRQRPTIPVEDEVRFALHRYGVRWTLWAVFRLVLGCRVRTLEAIMALLAVRSEVQTDQNPYAGALRTNWGREWRSNRVSVIIPTIDRYPYLKTLLSQLGRQSVPPHEVIVADQTPEGRREDVRETLDVPFDVNVLYLDRAGQCTARNAAIKSSTGNLLLFLDDDDEVGESLVEMHIRSLKATEADVSCGVAQEAGAGPLPHHFRFVRVSDVFPTNNVMVKREALTKSGLFDLAYDTGQRADGDLGMRLYLAGMLMVLDPSISVFHHHAPAGGLRTHKARVITYASSRTRITHRQIPSATEFYLAERYFSARQQGEMYWLGVLGTFAVRGGLVKRLTKIVFAAVALPATLRAMAGNRKQATTMLKQYPDIPSLA